MMTLINARVCIIIQRLLQMDANRLKIKFCCYELEGQADDREQDESKIQEQRAEGSVPMLSMGTNSKIKFSNVSKKNDQPIFELLLQLYKNEEKSKLNEIMSILAKKRINPDFKAVGEREDLEYYIPQLITYLVIEENLEDPNLIEIILDACSTDFYFAHSVYFYLNSFTHNWKHQPIEKVQSFIQDEFLPKMSIYCANRLSGIEFTKGMMAQQKNLSHFPALTVKKSMAQSQNDPNELTYGTKRYPDPPPQFPQTITRFRKKKYCDNGFMETPSFWNDLVTIGEDVSSVPGNQRNELLDHLIKTRVNEKLPASVYIPFFKDKLRMYTVLCVWKGRLFSTKERAPFSIWVQLYREEEELELIEEAIQAEMEPMKCPKSQKKQKIMDKIYETLSKPFNSKESKNTINIKRYLEKKFRASVNDSGEQEIPRNQKQRGKYINSLHEPQSANLPQSKRISLSFAYSSNHSEDLSNSVNSQTGSQKEGASENAYQSEPLEDYFPIKSNIVIEEFRKRSIYRDLKSWRIAHMMVKTGDDLKQGSFLFISEQFAMQLITNIANIFKKQKIECVVFPYEVISLGPNYGLIQMLQDVTTFDALFKNLNERNLTLKQFFGSYFPDKQLAKRNFMKSLAGYCLVTYFLQVKDRHNGNILLHREGYFINIDFGFFLSNMPGKGVELQKNVPFKLLTEYVQVIGSLNSESFFEFRQLFYRGFLAIIKHKASLIALVKMMYSSHGQSMGCFIKSEQAVTDFEKRLSPPENVEEFCYDLINSSLDNWRSKWYDKFQYFLQKIYY